jgi:hypothetical protein
MKSIFTVFIKKLFFKKWIIGICRDSIKDIIRNKSFDPDINWIKLKSHDKIIADPFFLDSKDGNYKIIYEELIYKDNYGKISIMSVDENLRKVNQKMVLDTKSHLSYPFVFKENNKTYVFPESKQNGKFSCYEYDSINETLNFSQDILEIPLLDSTIIKHNNKYWIFGTISKDTEYYLHLFFSDCLLGPYLPHPDNPVKSGLNGTRSAGNFIEVDGILYRPSQNCENDYGESITINKVSELNEINFIEEPYMSICINTKNKNNDGVHTIHTINVMDNIIVVDGIQWCFRPIYQIKYIAKRKFKLN